MPTIIDPTPQQVLDLEIGDNDSGASTVRGYLVALLLKLWEQSEMFSGKRPFGNSGWGNDFSEAFIRAGFVKGEILEPEESGEDWPEVQSCDYDRVNALVFSAIRALGEVR